MSDAVLLVMRRLGLVVATCGYIGYVPLAPGTVGSLAGLALFAWLRSSGSSGLELAAIVIVLAAGVWSSSAAEEHFGDVDPAPVVIDEVAGMLITLAFVPVNAYGAAAGFLVFRLFDVIKPWPAGRLEALPGGLGVMADDAMAAVYGNVTLRVAIAVTPAGWLA